jgi:hypothetical protein
MAEEGTNNSQGTQTPLDPPAVIDPNRPFAFGIVALLLGVGLSIIFPDPSMFQRGVFTVVLALGGAGFTTAISGFLEVKSKMVTGGGCLGVFIFICFFMWQTTKIENKSLSEGLGTPFINNQPKPGDSNE